MNHNKIFNNLSLSLPIFPFVMLGLVICGAIEGAVVNSSLPPGEPTDLVAFIEVQGSVQQGSGEPIMVKFLLKNNTEKPLYLLKWYTPLEGIAGDIFDVTRDGQEIPYLGIMAFRGGPTPESYILLEPGEEVTAEVNIAEAYDFSQPGSYTIKFRPPNISHIAWSEEEMATTVDELGPVNIPSNEVTLEVVSQ